jgi:hypothetical protein
MYKSIDSIDQKKHVSIDVQSRAKNRAVERGQKMTFSKEPKSGKVCKIWTQNIYGLDMFARWNLRIWKNAVFDVFFDVFLHVEK